MSDSQTRAPIDLPRWYASLAVGADKGGLDQRACSDDARRIGPLTVFGASRGCEIAAFDNGSSAVVFDGYLFDRAELASDLALPSHASTGELIVAAFLKWGPDFFDRLDGCYLIAIWDAEGRRLLIGHDALGRHPVFYAVEAGVVWFASSVLALASSGRVPNRPNRLSLALAALLYWPEAGQTFFERIRRVRPGHYLEVTSRQDVAEHKYWDPIPDDDAPWLSEEQVLEEFEPALTRAVSRCMALSPQGIMLSGGVDSVTIAALASEYSQARNATALVAVAGRTGRELSAEERMQGRVIDVLKMPHRISTTSDWTRGRDDISVSLEVTQELPAPSRIYWVGTYMSFYRQTAAQNLNVLLTGSGGDNWLGVADTHAADLMRSFRLRELWRFMKVSMGTGGLSFRASADHLLWSGGLRLIGDTAWARVSPGTKGRYHRRRAQAHLPHWLCPDRTLKEELVHSLVRRRPPALTGSGGAPRNYNRHTQRSTSSPHLHYEFEVAHHVETSCGLRLLSPYHDRRLVSFFNRIPPRVLVHGDRYKGLLRPVAAKHLPTLGLENQRKDYPKDAMNFTEQDLRKSVAKAWPDRGFATLGRLGVVDPAATETEGEKSGSHSVAELARMFALMSAERWVRAHADV